MDLSNLNKDRDRRRRPAIDITTMVYGKVPPQSRDLERAILGAILLDSESFSIVIEILKPECFYVESHQRIFTSMQSLMNANSKIDILTVVEQLKNNDSLEIVGGPYFVTQLTNAVVSTAHLQHHCEIVYQKYIQRELIRLSGEILNDSYEDSINVFEMLAEATEKIRNINQEIQQKRIINVSNVSFDVIKSLHVKAYNAREGVIDKNLVYTGFTEWDRINGSLFPGLFIVAGRPGMGKGIMLTELICKMGKLFPVGVVNGEMTNEQLMIRVGCNLKDIDNELWKKQPIDITDEDLMKVNSAMEEAQMLQLHLHDDTYLHKITAKIRLWVEKFGVKVVLIDFLTLIKVLEEYARYMTDTQKLNYIMDVLRCLCKELSVPIILFCQLNRELYKRGGNKEPNLSDLKGSGNIEEFAYQISFLHRPEYYDIMEDQDGESTRGLMYHILAKHRDGRLGRLKYKFIPQCSKLDRWEGEVVQGWKPTTNTTF